MTHYKLAIFDFDGTLANSMIWFEKIVNELADAYGFKRIDEDEIELLRGYDALQIMKHLGLPAWKLAGIATHVRKMMSEQIHEVPLYDGVDTMLTSLADQGVTIAVVSSNIEDNVRCVLGPDLVALVRTFECGVSLWGKAAKLRKVLRHTGMSAADAIYVGDEIRDVQAARDVGMAAGAVVWGYNHAAALEALAPTSLFWDVAAITSAIAGLAY
jgi:phosphoglycolate phosphatase